MCLFYVLNWENNFRYSAFCTKVCLLVTLCVLLAMRRKNFFIQYIRVLCLFVFWHRRHKFYNWLWSRKLGIRITVNQPYMEFEHLWPSSKCFTYVTKTVANLTTYSRKPGDYNGTIIFEIDVMKNSSPLNLIFTFFAMSKPK